MMKTVIGIGMFFFLLSCVSCSKSSPRISPNELIGNSCEDPVMLEFRVSNQSTSLEVVDIKASIDGRVLVDEDFECAGQHYWKYFYFKMCHGKHTVSAISQKGGATIQMTFDFTKDDSSANLTYWYYDEKHYDPTPKSFKFEVIEKHPCEQRETQFAIDRCKTAEAMETRSREERIRKQLLASE